jgi:hypothetical protein
MDFNLYLQLPSFTYTAFISVVVLLTLMSLLHKTLDAIIVNKTPIEKLTAYYYISSLNYKKQSQPHREVKHIPKTKVVAESSLHK